MELSKKFCRGIWKSPKGCRALIWRLLDKRQYQEIKFLGSSQKAICIIFDLHQKDCDFLTNFLDNIDYKFCPAISE